MKPTFLPFQLLVLAWPALAAAQGDDLSSLWKDPTFQRQFVGSYGINAEIEPRLTPEEVKLLEKIRPKLEAGNPAAAEAELAAKMKDDASASLDFALGTMRYQQENFAGALQAYERAVEKFPSFRRAWRNIGLIHARGERYPEAIRAFTRMIELGGGDAYSYGLLAFAYSALEDYQASEVAYRNALLLQPDNTDWRFGLTKCAFKQEKYQDASTLLGGLLERYPDKADFWLLQASAFIGMKQPLRAAQNHEIVYGLGKSTLDGLQTLGDLYVNEDLLDLAASAYRRGVELDTTQPFTRPLRAAEVLASRGAVADARALLAHAREKLGTPADETERRRLLKLDARLSMADGKGGEDTVRVLEEIIALDPFDGEALMLLAQHSVELGEPDQAIFYYERAASLEAFEVKAKIGHAQILLGQERWADALPLLRRAQEIRPREDVARLVEQVERIARTRR